MDIIDLLIQDHHEVNGLFGRFKQSSQPDTQEKLAKLHLENSLTKPGRDALNVNTGPQACQGC